MNGYKYNWQAILAFLPRIVFEAYLLYGGMTHRDGEKFSGSQQMKKKIVPDFIGRLS